MPYGEHLARCFDCGTSFVCGDCIPSFCAACKCKRYGHCAIDGIGFCLRCCEPLPAIDDAWLAEQRDQGAA